MANNKRGVGLSAFSRNALTSDHYASHGAALRSAHADSLANQLSVFQAALHSFSLTHGAEIRSNPTFSTSFDHDQHQDTDIPSSTPTPTRESRQPAANVEYKWTSRNNRKGRHAITIKPQSVDHPEANISTPRLTTHWRSILHVLWRMLTYYPVWDVSWCVAYIFTLGSVLWVINSFFAFLPLLKPSTEFHNETLVGGGVTAFIGATIFEIGSVLLMLEAINENREGCFGWAVEKVYNEYFSGTKNHHGGGWKIVPDEKSCTHHHRNKKNLVGKPHNIPQTSNDADSEKQTTGTNKSWIWCPSWVELKTHYFHELGFIACFSQLLGATVFWISGFTALPGIYNNLSPAAVDGAFWFPQVLGGCG